MSYYALKDSDWSWDDQDEGRATVVCADTPEEAIKIGTAIHLAEHPGAGGVTWSVARLNLVAFGDASWEDDNNPTFEALTYYEDGINGPPDSLPPEPNAQKIITETIGFNFEPGELQTVNADDLIRLSNAFSSKGSTE